MSGDRSRGIMEELIPIVLDDRFWNKG